MPSLFCIFRFCLLLICRHDCLISFCIQFHETAALREFDVYVEGSLVIDNIDIFRAAPGKDVPYIVTLNTFVTDGAITIEFVAGINYPQINAIEVLTAGAPKSTPVAVPIARPVNVPVKQPPVAVPIARPVTVPVKQPPVAVPIARPVIVPVKQPTVAVPIARPVTVPVKQPPVVIYPTAVPLALPPNSEPVPVPPPGTFKDIFINCGGKSSTRGNIISRDKFT
jgi:Malectin domain